MMMVGSICSFVGFTFIQFIYDDQVPSFGLSTIPIVLIALYSGLMIGSFNPALGLLLDEKSLAIGVSIVKFVSCLAAASYPLVFSYINTKDGEEHYGYTAFWLMVVNGFGVITCVAIYMMDIRGRQILEKPYGEAYEEKGLEDETKTLNDKT